MAIPEFLKDLLTANAPSGYETPAAEVWRKQAESFAAGVESDTVGSSVARVEAGGDGAPLVGLVGHIDEIGLVVKHITARACCASGRSAAGTRRCWSASA